MEAKKLDPKIEARLNELLRPAKGVEHSRVLQGILETLDGIPDRDQCATALAHVFAYQHYANLSGSPTPESEYPEEPEVDECADHAFDPDQRILRNFRLLTAQLASESADVAKVASRATAFLGELPKDGIARHAALHAMLHERVFSPNPAPGALRFEDGTTKTFHATLWKYRDVLREIDGVLGDPRTQTKTSRGANILAALDRISDKRDRASVFGYVFERQASAIAASSVQELATLAAVLGMVG